MKNPIVSKFAFWCHLGPFFLIASLSLSLLKNFSLEAGFVFLGILGMSLIWKFEKRGFYTAIALLTLSYLTLGYFKGVTLSLFLFSITIGLSWLLTLLGERETCVLLAQERVKEQQSLEASLQQIQVLTQEISSHFEKEQSLQQSLECAQIQVRGLQEELASERKKIFPKAEQNNIISQEEVSGEERKNSDYWQNQYSEMRKQFIEKSEILEATRKEFFLIESRLLKLEREWQEHEIYQLEEEFSVVKHLKAMEEESIELQTQVTTLQECLSHLLLKSKTSRSSKLKSKNSSDEEALPLLF